MKSSRSFVKPALSDALSVVLPTNEQTLLLRACLYSGASARQAWREWQSHRNGLRNGFIGDDASIRGVRPLVLNALRRHDLEVDKESQTYLRSAYLKEELRSKILRRICRDILLLLQNEGIPLIVLKGTALAETVYDNPVLRHCHDIDILMWDQDMNRAASSLTSLGFKGINKRAELESHDFKLEHESGLPLELHSRLFEIPYYNVSLPEMWVRSQSRVIADVRAHILEPSDNLLHVCGRAYYSGSRRSLRWISDAWFIIERHRDLDWNRLLVCAHRSRLALPLSVTLGYLAEYLSAPVPTSFLSDLYVAASKSTGIDRELALFGARSSPRGGFRNLVRKARNWQARALIVKWMLLPSPTYVRWVSQTRGLRLLPVQYLYRPTNYGLRRILAILKTVLRRIGIRTGVYSNGLSMRSPNHNKKLSDEI